MVWKRYIGKDVKKGEIWYNNNGKSVQIMGNNTVRLWDDGEIVQEITDPDSRKEAIRSARMLMEDNK